MEPSRKGTQRRAVQPSAPASAPTPGPSPMPGPAATPAPGTLPARGLPPSVIFLGAVALLLVVVMGMFAFSQLSSGDPNAGIRGKVLFSTDFPGVGRCRPDAEVTTIKAGAEVYATYVFPAKQGDGVVTVSIAKDGAAYLKFDLSVSDTRGFDCFGDATNLGDEFGPGTYTYTLTSQGQTISEGTLTVTP